MIKFLLVFNFHILRTVALKVPLNRGRSKLCLGVIRAGVRRRRQIRAKQGNRVLIALKIPECIRSRLLLVNR